jgi:hypothetical protein
VLHLRSNQPEVHKLDYGGALRNLPRCRKWAEVAMVLANIDLLNGKMLF